ncbi:hypothetical protein ACH0CP_12735 [Sphingomonas sp. 179-I 2A4 NHS]|uniref:hypothetical protein n=1 Tax=unclassified Sphingomonas TaxID=196159 RepID=UPI003879B8AD
MTGDNAIATTAPASTVAAKTPKRKLLKVRGLSEGAQTVYEEHVEVSLNRQLGTILPRYPGDTEEKVIAEVDAAISTQALMAPRDAFEQQIILQMLALHNASLDRLGIALAPGQRPDAVERCLNLANKCSRTYAALLETLNRHRGKGQQRVTVEHVQVHAGGQAIVGAVNRGEEGA